MSDEKKLCIIGTATNRTDAPFDDDSWALWGTGGLASAPDVPRLDAVFELHPKRFWGQEHVLEALNKFPGRIYMHEHYDEIPNSVRFPVELVQQAFYMPTMGDRLFVTNTVSYMFAFAYLEGYTTIHTYGMWMEHETEYAYQRPNVEFYLGFLHAKGIDVRIHGGDVLKSAFLYGYEEPPMLPKLIQDGAELQAGLTDLENQVKAKVRELHMQQGGIEYNKQLRRKFGGY